MKNLGIVSKWLDKKFIQVIFAGILYSLLKS